MPQAVIHTHQEGTGHCEGSGQCLYQGRLLSILTLPTWKSITLYVQCYLQPPPRPHRPFNLHTFLLT